MRSRLGLQLALLTSAIVVTFQTFVAVPAIPQVDAEFHSGTAWATWLLTGFLLVSCIAAPLLGRVGDQFGKRRVLLGCAVTFAVGSLISTLGPTIGVVITGRLLQGVGGAMIPLGFSIVRDEFQGEEGRRAVALQATSLPIGISSALLLGGVADLLSWRYLFGLGAAAAVVAIIAVYRYVPESPTSIDAPLDIRGGLLLTGALVALLVGLTEGEHQGWADGTIIGLLAIGGILFTGWIVAERAAEAPMVDVRMLALRPVLATNVATFFSTGIAITGALVAVPRLLAAPRGTPEALGEHAGYGFSANTTEVGLYMLAWALPGLFGPGVARVMHSRLGSRWPMTIGCASLTAGLSLLAALHDASWQVLLALGLIGFGLPVVTSSSAQVTLESVEQTATGVALGINNVSRQVGGLIGGQLCAAILASRTIGDANLSQESVFVVAFGLCAASAAVSAVVALLVTPLRRRSDAGEPAQTPASEAL